MCEKKKILLVSYDYNLTAGGIQNTSYLLAEYLKKDMDVTIFCPSNGTLPCIENIREYKSRYKGKLFDLFSFFEVYRLHRKIKFDYALSTHYYCGFCLPFLKFFASVPYGIMTHGNEVVILDRFASLYRFLRYYCSSKWRRLLTIRNANIVFSNTSYTASLVKKICSRVNPIVIHPPISEIQCCEPTNNYNHVLLSICRLEKRKGCQDVIRALPKVISLIPDIQYKIAGSGVYEKELRNLIAELHLENNVCLLGNISEEEKKRQLKECGMFVMPSFFDKEVGSVEGFGISYIEANCYGKFVIGSYSGGIPEAIKVGVTGVLVKEHDIDAISNFIIEYYNGTINYDPRRCKEWAMQHHISNISKQYYEAISQSIKI